MLLQEEIINIAKRAKKASRILATLDSKKKDKTLLFMADNLLKKRNAILKANSIDIKNAKAKGLSSAIIERLTLNEKRIVSMSDGLKNVAALKDEVGVISEMRPRPNGLRIGKMGPYRGNSYYI